MDKFTYGTETQKGRESEEQLKRQRERERRGGPGRWSVFQDTMITWSWGSRKGGVEIAKSVEERGGLTEVGKGRGNAICINVK